MGYMQASEMAAMTDLDTALRWHLQSNCYPPVPLFMVEPAKAAIAAVVNGDSDDLIELPNGVTSKTYGSSVPAHAIVEELHLHAFVNFEAHADDPPLEDDDSE